MRERKVCTCGDGLFVFGRVGPVEGGDEVERHGIRDPLVMGCQRLG
jgi:hypothetical protein